jgi:hypothetical protein
LKQEYTQLESQEATLQAQYDALSFKLEQVKKSEDKGELLMMTSS